MRHPDRRNLSLVALPAAMVQWRGDGRLVSLKRRSDDRRSTMKSSRGDGSLSVNACSFASDQDEESGTSATFNCDEDGRLTLLVERI
jgi:hypothetical protein